MTYLFCRISSQPYWKFYSFQDLKIHMFMSDISLWCSALFIYVYWYNCSFEDDALVL